MQLSTSKLILLLLILSTIITSSSCTPDKGTLVSPTSTIEFSSQIPSPSETSTLKAITEPPIERFYRIVSDTDYLKDCRSQYPSVSNQQIGFRDIYPGKTTDNQIPESLGKPTAHNITIGGYEEWLYYDENLTFAYRLYTKNNVVDFVTIEVDREILLPLEDILNKYGCPDLIIAIELDPPPFAETPNYNKTFFIYHRAGIEIRFEGYPVSYSDPASVVSFVKPLSLKDYLEKQYKSGFLVNDFSSPVSLEEAVKGN